MEALARGCPLLQSVSISGCVGITSAGIKVLAENCRHLKALDISNTSVGDEGLICLSECSPGLISLRAVGCDTISDMGLIAVATMSLLQRFDMPFQSTFSTNALLQFSNGCPNLKVLGARGVRPLDIDFMAAFARAHPDLRDLDVGYSNIVDEALIEVSKLCPKLRKLCVGGCEYITDASIIAVTENCRHVEMFDFNGMERGSKLTDASIFSMADNCSELIELELSMMVGKNFTELALVQLIEKCTKLNTITLYHAIKLDVKLLMKHIEHLPDFKTDSNYFYVCNRKRKSVKLSWISPGDMDHAVEIFWRL
jgi:hypothetical protein